MAKTTEQYQDELAQLLINAGQAQYMIRVHKQIVTQANDDLNTLNQKIDAAKKAMQSHMLSLQGKAPEASVEATVEAPSASEQASGGDSAPVSA